MSFNYITTKNASGAEVYIDRGRERSYENVHIFDALYAKKDEIEREFGGPLSWERLEGKRACRVRAPLEGGYRSPEEDWPGIHTRMTDAMNRLVRAIKPHLNRLKSATRGGLGGAEGGELSDAGTAETWGSDA